MKRFFAIALGLICCSLNNESEAGRRHFRTNSPCPIVTCQQQCSPSQPLTYSVSSYTSPAPVQVISPALPQCPQCLNSAHSVVPQLSADSLVARPLEPGLLTDSSSPNAITNAQPIELVGGVAKNTTVTTANGVGSSSNICVCAFVEMMNYGSYSLYYGIICTTNFPPVAMYGNYTTVGNCFFSTCPGASCETLPGSSLTANTLATAGTMGVNVQKGVRLKSKLRADFRPQTSHIPNMKVEQVNPDKDLLVRFDQGGNAYYAKLFQFRIWKKEGNVYVSKGTISTGVQTETPSPSLQSRVVTIKSDTLSKRANAEVVQLSYGGTKYDVVMHDIVPIKR